MDVNDILRAVQGAIQEKYQGDPVYWDRLPSKFKRPSFTVELQTLDAVDLNRFLQRLTACVLVTCYVEADEFHDSSREALNRRQDGVTALFGSGFLQVGDRAVMVSARKGAGSPEAAEVTVIFSWTDGRTGLHDPEDPADPETAAVPRMEHFAIENTAGTGPAERKDGAYGADHWAAQAEDQL